MRRYRFIAFITLLVVTGTGCSIKPVNPWEKDLLAQKKMQLAPNPLEAYLDEHIYFSKEASSGGAGIGGGGCGCN